MHQAARSGDLTDHPGALSGAGVDSVRIEGMAAAVVGPATLHICAFAPPGGPHPTNLVAVGSAKVYIGGLPAARKGDPCACGATIVGGAISVMLG